MRPRTTRVLLALVTASACQHAGRRESPPARAPDQGVAYVYLEPLPREAGGLVFDLGEVAALHADGRRLPLEARPTARGDAGGQRLVAHGALPPGAYRGFAFAVRAAAVSRAGGLTPLLVPEEPVEAAVPFSVAPGRAAVVSLALASAVRDGFAFAPVFTGGEEQKPLPAVVGWVSHPGADAVTVFDKHARRVVAGLATGRGPRGVAVDAAARRGYVALSGEDRVDAVDLASGDVVGRVRLRPGDDPGEVALVPGGRLLLVLARGSRSAVLVDTSALAEVDRFVLSEEPSALVVDRAGRRAWVLGRRSSTVTALDLSGRSVLRTVTTEPEPLAAALDRGGARLYLVHGGSQHLTALSTADLSVAGRVFVGLGAAAIQVDPATDLLYVSDGAARRVSVYDPISAAPLESLSVPAAVEAMAIDDVEGALFLLMPEVRAVRVVDLASRAVRATLDLGPEPGDLALAGERR